MSLFGAANNKPTGLATSFSTGNSLFGTSQPQQQQTGGLFGTSNVSQPTFAFGQQQQKPAQQAFGGFGGGSTLLNTSTAQPQNNAFGGFGGTNNLFNRTGTTAFGQTATPSGSGGLFGTQNTSAFGGGLLTSNVVGTTIKFNPPAGTDSMMKNGISTNVSTKHHCLTAMKEYEGKSLEELRLEDYSANRKVGTVTAGGGLFGAAPAQNTGSLFGAASTSQPTTGFGLFGAAQPAASGGLFGQTSTASTGGLFGGTAQATGSTLFGAQAKPATGGLFGAQPQTSQTGGLFGSSTGAFGTTGQTNTGGLFGGSALGTQTTKTGFGFGLTNTTTTQSSIFNFGTTTTQAGGLFGANNQNKSIFGASTGGFGNTGTTGSLFNSNQTSTSGGLFGAKPTGFGTPNSTSGGLFGAPATQTGFGQTGSLFGGLGGAAQPTAGIGGGLLGNASSTLNLGAQVPPTQLTTDPNTANAQHQMLQQQILALATSPYGDSPLFRNSLDSSKNDQRLQPVSSAAQKQHLSPSQHKVETKPRLSVKPNFHKTSRLFDGLDDDEDSLSFRQSFVPRNNPKTLSIKAPAPASSTVLPLSVSMNLSNSDFGKSDFSHLNPQDLAASFLLATQSENQSLANSSSRNEPKFIKRNSKAPDSSGTQTDSVVPPDDTTSLTLSESIGDIPSETPKVPKWQTKKVDSFSGPRLLRDSNDGTTGRSSLNAGDDEAQEKITSPNSSATLSSPDSMKKPLQGRESFAKFHHRTPVTSPSQGKENSTLSIDSVRSPMEAKGGIKLHRPEYFTIPNKDQLDKQLFETGKCVVQDFTVGRDGYGSVHFPGTTDITDIDFDEIVHIRRKEVTLYPNDESKPELGCGLNKRAVITLDKVWPIDKSNHLPITSPQKLSAMGYKDKIERSTAKLQAKFVEYRPETGSWVFEVKHFSKYKLFDDSDDEEDMGSRPSGDGSASEFCKISMEHDTFIVQSSATKKQSNSNGCMPSDSQSLKNKGLGGYDTNNFDEEVSELPLTNEEWHTNYKATLFENFDDSDYLSKVEMNDNFLRCCSKPSVTSKMDQMRATLFGEKNEPSDLNDSWDLGKQYEMEARTRSRHSQLPRSLRVDTIVKDFKKECMTKFVEKQQVFQPEFEGIALNQEAFDVSDLSLLEKAKDHGFRNGSRAYRVSWKRNETAISCPIPQKSLKSLPISLFKKPSEAFKVIVSDVFDAKISHVPQEVAKILHIFLEFSSNDMHSDFPMYEMLENQELVTSLIDVDIGLPALRNAIKLCYSLFGSIDEHELMYPLNNMVSNYEISQRRRECFGNWLTETCKEELGTTDDASNIPGDGNIIHRIMLLLTSNQREEAVDLALNANFPRLALLISQENSRELQRILTLVIEEWESLGISDCIDMETLKVYKLLAGDFSVVSHVSDEQAVCAGLSWKHCLGANLWFGTHQNSSIKSVISKYTHMFEKGLCAAPMTVSPISSDAEMENNPAFASYDCCYHIMNLVADETYKPELALNPLTITQDIADYYPTWVLMSVLVTLGFCNLETASKLNISTNFAWQLERSGFWPWAVFVSSFLPSEVGRQSIIQDLMDRNCSSSIEFSKDELFLVNDLRINKKVIHRSKAFQAKLEKNLSTQLYHLLEAEEFVKAHELLVDQELSAHLYFNHKKEKDFLFEALETLSIHKHSIPSWDCKGGTIFEFLGLQKSTGNLSSQRISQNDLSESLFGIYNSFVLLLSKLVDFPVQTGVMESLLEEIAESVIVNIRMLNKLESGDILAPFMGDLPLLRDQSLAQMRKLSTDIVSSLTEPNNDELESGTSALAMPVQ